MCSKRRKNCSITIGTWRPCNTYRDIFCTGRVTEEDLQRVAAPTGGTVQASVNNIIDEIDVDIGSSTMANGVLGLVFGVTTTLVVDIAFFVQGNSFDELPERLIGDVRVSHIELSSAVVPVLDNKPKAE